MAKILSITFAKYVFRIITILSGCLFQAQSHTHFENITVNEGLPSNYIFMLVEDERGILWGGTDKGLIKYENGKWDSFTTDEGLPGNYVSRIFSDRNGGMLLYFSEKGLYYFDTKQQKLNKRIYPFEPRSKMLFGYADIDKDYILLKSNVRKMDDGYYVFNVKDKMSYKGDLKVEKNDSIVYLNGKKISSVNVFPNDDKINFMGQNFEIKYGQGLELTTKNGRKILIDEREGLPSRLLSGFVRTRSGDLLISTMGSGILLLHQANYKTMYKVENLDVRDICYKGPYYYLLSNDHLLTVSDGKLERTNFVGAGSLKVYAEEDFLYIGAFDKITKLDKNYREVEVKQLLPTGLGVSTFFKKDKDLYFSTYGRGFVKLSGNLQERYSKYPIINIEETFKIKNGYAAVSYQSGFMTVDKELNFINHYTKASGLPSNFVSYIFEDGNRIWIGMRNHLAYLENGKFTEFKKDSQISQAGIILNIFRDKKNHLWVISEFGIFRLINNELMNVGSLNILNDVNKRISSSIYNPEKNHLMVTTKNEISIIDLNPLVIHDDLTEPKFVQASYDNSVFRDEDHSFLIPNSYRHMEFTFESVDNTLLSKNILQYSLDGSPWTDFTHGNKLRFSNLVYGKYDMKVRSLSESGRVLEYPEVIKFKILGPIYLRWWFITLILGMMLLSAWLVINKISTDRYNKKIQEITVQEKIESERKRISRDLHDNIGAYTTSLISKIDDIKSEPEDINPKKLTDLSENAQNILMLLRQTIWILGSKNTTAENYFDNVKNYAVKFFSSYPDIKLEITEEIDENIEIDSGKGVSMFRVMQEAMQNIVKHANATKVKILLRADKKIFSEITDNGIGFDPEEKNTGFGIINMRERCAENDCELILTSGNGGTTVQLFEK